MSIGRGGSRSGGSARDDQAAPERPLPVPGKHTLVQSMNTALQMTADESSPVPDHPHRIASEGVSGASHALPHGETIQRLFGRHDVTQVKAGIGGPAAAAAEQLGARAYAFGDRVAFRQPPDLHTAAHEAAHMVQQRGGVQLAGGVGRSGDGYERNADAVADAVVAGRSAEGLLDPFAGAAGSPATSGSLQREAELDEAKSKEGLQRAEAALQKLEQTVAKTDQPQPDYIKDAVKLIRTMMSAGKIKIYAFDGLIHGKFKAGEIHLDGVSPDMINTTTLLHEGVHALHGQQSPKAAKNYSDAEGKPMGDPSTPKGQDLLRWKAYTEYWAYRARFDYYNAGKAEADKKSEAEIHKSTLGDAGVRVPMLQVKQFDPNFDPRVWKPKG